MKVSDCIKFSFVKSFRNKNNIFFIIILTICSLTLMGVLTYRNYHLQNLDNKINKDISFRSIIVTPNSDEIIEHYEDKNYDYGYDNVKNLDHVLEIYNMDYNNYGVQSETFKNDQFEGTIRLLYGSENSIPNNIIGTKINSTDTGVAICPTKFYPTITNDTTNLNKYIDGKDILNTSFKISETILKAVDGKNVNTGLFYEKTYKIVGLYNSSESLKYPFDCFISTRDMKELYDETLGEANENSVSSMIAIVDEQKNVEEVLEQISDLGFRAEVKAFVKTDFVNNLTLITNIIIFSSCIAIMLLAIFYVKKKNILNSNHIGIQQAFGFSNLDIQKNSLIEIVILNFISYIISIIIYEIIFTIISFTFADYFLYQVTTFNRNFLVYLIPFIVIIFLPSIINLFMVNNQLKKEPIYLIRGN